MEAFDPAELLFKCREGSTNSVCRFEIYQERNLRIGISSSLTIWGRLISGPMEGPEAVFLPGIGWNRVI